MSSERYNEREVNKKIQKALKKAKNGIEVKKNFMLNSAEHEITNAHGYEIIKKLKIIQAQISL